MPQAVLVIHGAGEPRLRQGKVHWEPLLAAGLGADYHVRAPRMPDPDDPRYQAWAAQAAALLKGIDHPVLVGHSFGASVLLKFLAQAEPRPRFRGLFLVATPFWSADLPEFALAPQELKRLRSLSPVSFFHGRDDTEVSLEHVDRYAQAMPQAAIHRLDSRGHEFDQETLPELVAAIRAVT